MKLPLLLLKLPLLKLLKLPLLQLTLPLLTRPLQLLPLLSNSELARRTGASAGFYTPVASGCLMCCLSR